MKSKGITVTSGFLAAALAAGAHSGLAEARVIEQGPLKGYDMVPDQIGCIATEPGTERKIVVVIKPQPGTNLEANSVSLQNFEGATYYITGHDQLSRVPERGMPPVIFIPPAQAYQINAIVVAARGQCVALGGGTPNPIDTKSATLPPSTTTPTALAQAKDVPCDCPPPTTYPKIPTTYGFYYPDGTPRTPVANLFPHVHELPTVDQLAPRTRKFRLSPRMQIQIQSGP